MVRECRVVSELKSHRSSIHLGYFIGSLRKSVAINESLVAAAMIWQESESTMSHTGQSRAFVDVPDRIRPAFGPLLEAVQYAEQTARDSWEFAVEIERLTAIGLTLNDFRWLVRAGLVEHQREVTLETDDGRAFRSTGDLTFPERTCFVLTAGGISLARNYLQTSAAQNEEKSTNRDPLQLQGNGLHLNRVRLSKGNGTSMFALPSWDPERKVLSVNKTIVKQFKWSAQNQEAVLCVFEEEGWPARIDDPLPPHPEQCSKRRLSDTIKCLNRKQNTPILHFRGDGTGEGIIWELVEQHDSDDGVSC